MKLIFFFLLVWSQSLSTQRTVPHKYDLMKTQMTWADAQNYCRVKYTDLAIILSDTDWLRLNKVTERAGLISPAWVGLYNSWHWSLNELPLKNVTFTYWYPGQPDVDGVIQACALIGMLNKWWDSPCTQLRPFICYNANFSGDAKFIGVPTPKMTWTDAQTYCRTHHTDLASSLNSSDNNILAQIKNIQSDSWIGLYRDTWKWSDGSNATNLPWAFGKPRNSGVNENCAVFYNHQLSDVRCNMLYYFFCHTDSPMRSQTVRVQVKSDGSVFDPTVQSSILQQIEQNLKEKGMLENITVSWKVQPDGNIFQKKKKDEL